MMKSKLTTKDIALIGLMLAAIEIAKIALSAIPGVELVTLLMVLFTLVLRQKMYYTGAAFVLLEGMLWGFGIWWFMYMYTWPLLVFIVLKMEKNTSVLMWSILCAAFGLFYGALCSIPYYFVGGPGAAVSWWVAGIPTDMVHCVNNFVVCMLLFKPLKSALDRAAAAIKYKP